MIVVEFIVSLPTPQPLDVGPQVVLDRIKRGSDALCKFLLDLTCGFTTMACKGAWRNPETQEVMAEDGVLVKVAFEPGDVEPKTRALRDFLTGTLGPMWRQQAIYFQVGTIAEILQCEQPEEAPASEPPVKSNLLIN